MRALLPRVKRPVLLLLLLVWAKHPVLLLLLLLRAKHPVLLLLLLLLLPAWAKCPGLLVAMVLLLLALLLLRLLLLLRALTTSAFITFRIPVAIQKFFQETCLLALICQKLKPACVVCTFTRNKIVYHMLTAALVGLDLARRSIPCVLDRCCRNSQQICHPSLIRALHIQLTNHYDVQR